MAFACIIGLNESLFLDKFILWIYIFTLVGYILGRGIAGSHVISMDFPGGISGKEPTW